MKNLFLLICCCVAALLSYSQPLEQSQTAEKRIAIIPEPVSLKQGSGSYTLPDRLTIWASDEKASRSAVRLLQYKLTTAAGIQVAVSGGAAAADRSSAIKLLLNASPDEAIGQEGYRLSVAASGISIAANQPAGLYYGVQSLLQLLPKEIESAQLVKGIAWKAPLADIIDYPRFGWRGVMLDVARHFFTKEEVKVFIDDMTRYKFNLLHFHLSDDQGWRIEIKALPKLTETGAWNVKKEGYFGTFSKPLPNEPRNYGGFYTQEDIKELVAYAKERFVNIMPEIDVPGHSLAAIASYPELSCTPGASQYKVNSGENFMKWGPKLTALVDNTLCPANEKVYVFLDKVFSEIASLFPFDYIHVGGDECAKNFWEQSAAVRSLMQKEKLKNMEEVQAYFEKRLQKIIMAKGKKFLGWDEILEGGLAPGAAVMSWRGVKGGIEAAKLGHEVVMTPSTHTYVDLMQGDPITEPRVYSSVRLQKSYQFDPVPAGVDARLIKGGQANLWTEQIYNTRHLQYMLWPRGLAIAESLWSPREKKNWDGFIDRVERHFQRFDIAEIKYSRAMYDPIFVSGKKTDSPFKIALDKEIEGLDIYYSFDNSFPDRFYPKYAGPLIPPKDAVMLKVITYRGKTPVGRMIAMPIDELKKRLR